MAADLTAYRLGLAANLEAATLGATISPYVLMNPDPPIIWVRPSQDVVVEYHQAMRDGVELWHFLVQAWSGAFENIEAQQLLDTWAASSGPASVKVAIESDDTLGGTCQDVTVTEFRAYSEFLRPDGSTLIAAEWVVQITA